MQLHRGKQRGAGRHEWCDGGVHLEANVQVVEPKSWVARILLYSDPERRDPFGFIARFELFENLWGAELSGVDSRTISTPLRGQRRT